MGFRRILWAIIFALCAAGLQAADPAYGFIISGYVRTGSGTAVPGVTITAVLDGPPPPPFAPGSSTASYGNYITVTTNSGGYYQFDVPADWEGIVTPSKTDLLFSPSSRQYPGVSGDMPQQNYTAVPCLTDTNVDLPSLYYSSVAWGDYDGDGDLDLAVAGNSGGIDTSRIYRNDGNGTFVDINAGLPGVYSGAVAWGDCDKDGDLDIAIAGSGFCRVYRNNGNGAFADVYANLTGMYVCSVAWVDYDNDGDMDLAVSGGPQSSSVPATKLYRNNGSGAFIDANVSIVGVTNSSMAWGDYDNDGDMDLALAGMSGSNTQISCVYRNDGNGTFVDINAGLTGVSAASLVWGDYDNDGDLDLAVSGVTTSGPSNRIYRNDGSGRFVDINAGLIPTAGSVSWGDYDNDGDLDLAMPINGRSIIYRNQGDGSFVDSGMILPGVAYSSSAWGDYDDDGDLDLIVVGNFTGGRSKLYQNNKGVNNTEPVPPSYLAADADNSQVTFFWTDGSDAQTPVSGLSYNLRVGTSPGASDVFCGMAQSTGKRLVPAAGNVQKGHSWVLKSPPTCTLYWSVQCIDTAYAGSTWSEEQTLDVPPAFEELTLNLFSSSGPAVWGDCDNDGDLDLVAGGSNRFYRNDGNGVFTPGGSLPPLGSGCLALGDCDNDGDLDLAVSGSAGGGYVTRIYRNDGKGSFTDMNAGLPGASSGSLAWGDYDNDGDLDLAAAGSGLSKIFRNDGGTFMDAGADLPAALYSSLAWGDYDNDGDLDLVLGGSSGGVLCRNDDGAFTPTDGLMNGMRYYSLAWGDFDNDGDLDLATMGYYGSTRVSRIYRNDGSGGFVDINAGLIGLELGSLAWGDYDNDGDLDLAINGRISSTGSRTSRIYRNDGNGIFTDIGAVLPAVGPGWFAWGDYDDDGDLDLVLTGSGSLGYLTKIIRNNSLNRNTAPTIPSGLSSYVSGQHVTLQWLASSDQQTPSNGLSYNIRVGTAPGKCDLFSGMATASGTRLLPAAGNAQKKLSWTLKGLPAGMCFWSVQAVDTAYAGSSWAANQMFVKTAPTITGITPAAGTNDGTLDVSITGTGFTWGDAVYLRKQGQNDIQAWGVNIVNSRLLTCTIDITGAPTGLWDVVVIDSTGQSGVMSRAFDIVYPLPVVTEISPDNAGNKGSVSVTVRGSGFYPGVSVRITEPGEPDVAGTNVVLVDSNTITCDFNLNGVTTGRWSVVVTNIDQRSAELPEGLLVTSRFNPVGPGLPALWCAASAWGDYDNDGDLDLVISGLMDGETPITRIYRNEGGGTFVDAQAGLLPLYAGCSAWGDYDGDGDLDLVVAGNKTNGRDCRIYRNDGNSIFTDVGAGIRGVSYSSAAWGDFDNDGDLDLALAGDSDAGRIGKIYRNDGGDTFTDTEANLTSGDSSSVAWGDYDNDGDLDLASMGHDGQKYFSIIYRNDCGQFTDIGAGITAVNSGTVAWADYDCDGDLDLAICGSTGSGQISKIYRNDGNGTFTDINAGLAGVFYACLAWGDFDNDGDPDLALAGQGSGGGRVAKIYRNDGGSFLDMEAGLKRVDAAALAWGDCDGDGDLDLVLCGRGDSDSSFSSIYRNDGNMFNTAPSTPSGLASSVNGNDLTLSWLAAADAQTPASGLCYNLRVGTSPGKDDVFSGMAGPSGVRRLPWIGNAQKMLQWTLKDIPSGCYYWSVQCIDSAFCGSGWAGEQMATVPYDFSATGKKMADGLPVKCDSAVVSAVFDGFFYMEAENRSWGIRVVKQGYAASVGDRVSVTGLLRTNSNCERFIEPLSMNTSGKGSVKALGMTCRSLGGSDFGYDSATGAGQRGTGSASGLNNIGLLVRIWGRVSAAGRTGWYYVEDGSGVEDGTGFKGIYVTTANPVPRVGSYVCVTGISSCEPFGDRLVNCVLERSPAQVISLSAAE